MWYFSMMKVGEDRPTLLPYNSESDAAAAKAQLDVEFPDAEFGDVFEESGDYYASFPHVIGEYANLDGSLDLLWSDGQRTPKPA